MKKVTRSYQEVKEDGLWEVVERSNVWELAMRRRKILNLNSGSVACGGHHLLGLQWKECYQTKPVFSWNKKMKERLNEGRDYQRFCR